MRSRVPDYSAKLSRHAWAPALVWELTAYTNDYVTNADHFSGELHRPISWLGVSYCKVSHLLPNYVPPR